MRPTRRRTRMSVWAVALCVAGGGMAGCTDDATNAGPPVPRVMHVVAPTQADATPPDVPYSTATPVVAPHVRASWPHDTAAFTQGLVVYQGRLLEGTGLEGRSELRDVDRRSGRVRRRATLPPRMFGEGIAVVDGRIYQLTWLNKVGFVYDAATLAPIDSFHYEGEGWGLTTDGTSLFMSDGSSRLRIVDPNGFRTVRTLQVSEVGRPVWMLNELEYIHGEIWANIYRTDFIARIDATTGNVIGWLDLRHLLTPAELADVEVRGGVANGIAFDSTRNEVLLTGKLWPRLFEVDVPR